jgi:hypothetical protein
VNESRDEERLAAAFRKGWRSGIYYERNPHTEAQLNADEDAATEKFLAALRETDKKPTTNLGY